jgi:hypothetical protein
MIIGGRRLPTGELPSVALAPSSSTGDINKASSDPPYSMRSNKQADLLSPLHTPRRPRHINLVSDSRPGASATMSSTPDNRPPGAIDPARQDDLTATLHSIMAQLMTISNRLDLQGTTLAKHALLLDGAEGSAVAGGRSPGLERRWR